MVINFGISNTHYKKICILRLLKWQIATVTRAANVHLWLFPNRHWCWGRYCLLRQFREQLHQLSQSRHFNLISTGLRPLTTVANVKFFKIKNKKIELSSFCCQFKIQKHITKCQNLIHIIISRVKIKTIDKVHSWNIEKPIH